MFLEHLDQRQFAPKLLLERLGQPALTPRLCESPLGGRTNLGSLVLGQCSHQAPSFDLGDGVETSPESQAPTVGANSWSTARHSACPSEMLLVEIVCVNVGRVNSESRPSLR